MKFIKHLPSLIPIVLLLLSYAKTDAQVRLQDKAYFDRDSLFIPATMEDKIGVLYTHQENAPPINKNAFEFPVKIAKTLSYKIKYCLIDSTIFSLSMSERRGVYHGSLFFIAFNKKHLKPLSEPKNKVSIEKYGTFHYLKHCLLLGMGPPAEAIDESYGKKMLIDLIGSPKENLQLLVALKDTLKVWEYPIAEFGYKKLIDEVDPDFDHFGARLIAQYPLSIKEDFLSFYQEQQLYILGTSSGQLHHLDLNGNSTLVKTVSAFGSKNEEDKPAVLIDANKDQVFLIPKNVIAQNKTNLIQYAQKLEIE